ncbi:GTPase Era [Coprothermobacteraceae bacterium]|nr:GTPase Era [Coprothermobacteraceae bacterium]
MNTLYKSGFVGLVGRPNVGKSTLLNALIKQKVAIVTEKPQTTRRPIRGILTSDDAQIVFVDLPGIHKAFNALSEYMLEAATQVAQGSDVNLFIVDGSAVPPGTGDVYTARTLMKTGVPSVLVMNKVDLVPPDEIDERLRMFMALGDFVDAVPVSATTGKNLDLLLETVKKYLPEGPKFYPEDMKTDQPVSFLVGEVIREKIIQLTGDEIPYSVEVQVDFVEDGQDITRINSTIFVEKESQKPIIIGANGRMIKQIGTLARKELEAFLGKHVFLGLWVKVKENWRDNREALRQFGYGVE